MKTKIDERREREQFEREHPWQPMTENPPDDGSIVQLLFGDMAGAHTMGDAGFFLSRDEDGRPLWICVDRIGARVPKPPMNWRPTNRKLSLAKREEIKAANPRWHL